MLGRWRGLPGRRGRAMPGSWGLAAIRKKKALPPREDWNFCDIGATNVKETRLGEPVLGEPVLGEPSNEVGASHQTRLGEPSNEVGRASTKPLGEPLNHSGLHACFKAAPWRYGASSARARSAHLVPARHGACSAHLVPARHCTPSTVPARHRGANFPTSARSARQHVPARHI